MCGRFTLHTPESRIRVAFNLEQAEPLGLEPRFNIAPSQPVPIIRDTDAGREMVLAKWGLVPHWSKEPKTKYSTINARIETVAEKPVLPDSLQAPALPHPSGWLLRVGGERRPEGTPSHPHERWGCVCPRRPVGSLGR